MDLTVTEAAELLGTSARTLRARVSRGAVPARKVDGAWRIRREDLPLTEAQRDRLQARATGARAAVEQALSTATRARTLLDLDAFRVGMEVLAELRVDPALAAAAARLERALVDLGAASHTWERGDKLAALARARAGVGEVAALVLLHGDPMVVQPLVGRLEGQVSPAIAGLSRWVARRERS